MKRFYCKSAQPDFVINLTLVKSSQKLYNNIRTINFAHGTMK